MTTSDRKILYLLLALSLVLRLACLNLNSAEYTDGILQLTAFERGFTFWPPVYSIAVKLVALAVGDPERAGKLVSILSSTLLLIPLFGLTQRLVSRRAAIYAALFYLTDPIAVRWGIRVMSDALFMLLFFWAAALFLRVSTVEQTSEASGFEEEPSRGVLISFVIACVLAPVATLTRYQGLLLLPVELLALNALLAQRRRASKSGGIAVGIVVLLPWLFVVAWLRAHAGGHEQQIAERAGQSFARALVNYWNLAESFLFLFPYFITVAVFVLFAAGLGLFIAGDRPKRRFAWSFVFFAVVIIAMQSVFSSFQERYLLPLVPFMMVLAGTAAARWEERAGPRLAPARTVLVLALIYSLAFSAGVLILQREAFGDLKQAARYCATEVPREARIFSNEWFKDLPAVKMSFWAGRTIEGYNGMQRLAKGDYLCLHSGYGGLSPYPALVRALRFPGQLEQIRSQYDCQEMAWFSARLIPLLPDIMENPDTHQNPVAWFYRYYPQQFRTVVLRIEGPRATR